MMVEEEQCSSVELLGDVFRKPKAGTILESRLDMTSPLPSAEKVGGGKET